MTEKQEDPLADPNEDEKEELIPNIDLLSLAEERAASAPLTDFGVNGDINSSLRIVLRIRIERY